MQKRRGWEGTWNDSRTSQNWEKHITWLLRGEQANTNMISLRKAENLILHQQHFRHKTKLHCPADTLHLNLEWVGELESDEWKEKHITGSARFHKQVSVVQTLLEMEYEGGPKSSRPWGELVKLESWNLFHITSNISDRDSYTPYYPSAFSTFYRKWYTRVPSQNSQRPQA